MSTISEKDGVVDYPIADNMPLTGIWNYSPNENGPAIVAKQDYLEISRGPKNIDNQWTFFSLQHSVQITAKGGCIFQVELKYDVIQPATEVKLTLSSGVILRYNDGEFNYCYWTRSGFTQLGRSSIALGDRKYHKVVLCFWPSGLAIFEDGNFIAKWDQVVAASLQPTFHWQIFSRMTSLQAEIRNILVIPPVFASGVNTPWDLAFSSSSIPPADVWTVSKQKGNPLPISYSDEGYMRVATGSLNKYNSWIFPSVTVPMSQPAGLVMYRMRLNTSGGSETKVTVLGDNILRVTDGGRTVQWTLYKSAFETLSPSSIVVGSGIWTIVTVVYSSTTVSLFEDGVYKYSRNYSPSPSKPWLATFSVQHLDLSTAVSVDLSNVRCVPLNKTAEMLIRDLQPTVLAYYPLKTNLSETIIGHPALDLVAVNNYYPNFVPGAFGNAINFSAQHGALKLPLYPFDRSLPSYTLSLWVKVANYPTEKTGIIGPLYVRADGKLDFDFLYSNILSYNLTTFTSTKVVPKGQWISIIVTYAFEESRFALFIDGVLDSIAYTSPDNSSSAAILPMNGFVGGSEGSTAGSTFLVLDGQISDVMFFRQHVHNRIALALANQPVTDVSEVGGRHVQVFFPLLLPVFFIIAYGAISTSVIASTLNQKDLAKYPLLQTVVDRIVEKVGKPAAPGSFVTRQDLRIDEDYLIIIDIGGEGPLNEGLVTGFENAINLNAVDFCTVCVVKNKPIPYLVKVQPWHNNPSFPFANNFADKLTMIGCPLTAKNADEMVRVIKPEGTIDVWIDDAFLDRLEDMARQLKSSVKTPHELDRFKGNGDSFRRRQIVANKNGHDEL